MKFSSQEEYGLRCLLRIARDAGDKGLTIPEISQAEGITTANVAKLLRILRLGGILESSRGQIGGYNLCRKADKITLSEVFDVLGRRLYDSEFCSSHAGVQDICTNSTDCSLRSLWQTLQNTVDDVLTRITLKDLISSGDVVVNKIMNPNKEYIDIAN